MFLENIHLEIFAAFRAMSCVLALLGRQAEYSLALGAFLVSVSLEFLYLSSLQGEKGFYTRGKLCKSLRFLIALVELFGENPSKADYYDNNGDCVENDIDHIVLDEAVDKQDQHTCDKEDIVERVDAVATAHEAHKFIFCTSKESVLIH